MPRNQVVRSTKRDEFRSKKQKEERQRKLITIGAITLGVILLAMVIILPQLNASSSNLPVIEPTAKVRPQANFTSMGDPNAPVKVEEYADFQCPACKYFFDNLEPLIIEQYVQTGKVYFTYVPYSFLDNGAPGRESKAAAEAALCAADQGKFWEYHDYIYVNQKGENEGNYSNARLKQFAEKLNLNMKTFNSCFDSGKYTADVEVNYMQQGRRNGVSQTPLFLINGSTLVDQRQLLQALDAALTAVQP